MKFIDDLKYKYARLNALEKIIAINVIVFLVATLLKPVIRPLLKWFELKSDLYDTILQPWSVLSYAFLHYDFFHLLFNMLWLYFVGRLFLNLFSIKTALNVYFLGAISGAVFFLIGYNALPQIFATSAYLVGASAAVRALMLFLCTYSPNQEVRVFTFNIKLMYIGIALVVLDVIGILGDNSGGNLAHLGGAFLGYLYAKQLAKGNDIGSSWERFMDYVSHFFSKKERSVRMKTVHNRKKNKTTSRQNANTNDLSKQKRIDAILDKIGKSGYESLSKEEKDFLFRAGN
jgi:membrane associated rhomboid family serine protease